MCILLDSGGCYWVLMFMHLLPYYWMHLAQGFADLNHWFKSWFKLFDFLSKKSNDLNHTDDFTYQWKIINPFITYNLYYKPIFNLFVSSMNDFTVIGPGTLILCSVQLSVWEIFCSLSYTCDALQHNINWKTRKYEFFLKRKIWFK